MSESHCPGEIVIIMHKKTCTKMLFLLNDKKLEIILMSIKRRINI